MANDRNAAVSLSKECRKTEKIFQKACRSCKNPKENSPCKEAFSSALYVLSALMRDQVLRVRFLKTYLPDIRRKKKQPYLAGIVSSVKTYDPEALKKRILKERFSERELEEFFPRAYLYLLRTICEETIGKNGDADKIRQHVAIIRSLSAIREQDVIFSLSEIDRIFMKEPSGIYSRCDDDTKIYYRKRLFELARIFRKSPEQTAYLILQKAREGTGKRAHVGYYLTERNFSLRTALYFGLIGMISLLFPMLSFFIIFSSSAVLAGLFALVSLLPSFLFSKEICDFLFSRLTEPVFLPSVRLNQVPKDAKTLCVITALIKDENSIDELLEDLKLEYYKNREENVYFGILADFAQEKKTDRERMRRLYDYAAEKTSALNASVRDCFYFFIRSSVYSECEGVYMGWERKRGALIELVRFFHSGQKQRGTFHRFFGNLENLFSVRYILTLDSDTRMPIGAVRKMIAAAQHPLNRPSIGKDGIVTDGYGVFQPSMTVNVREGNHSPFTQITGGEGGFSPYSAASYDAAMAIFGQGIFCGKGLFDVDAFYKTVCDAFPENTVLSHDNLEGARLRCAMFSKVTFSDATPSSHSSFDARYDRWVRGDVQALRFCRRHVPDAYGNVIKNPLGYRLRFLLRYNVLRECRMPAFLLLFFLSAFLPSRGALLAVLLFLISDFQNLQGLYKNRFSPGFRSVAMPALKRALLSSCFRFAALAHHAYLSVRAVATALFRITISKKHLLLWVTASEHEKKTQRRRKFFLKDFAFSIACGILFLLRLRCIFVFFGLLFLSLPFLIRSLERPYSKNQKAITAAERTELLKEAEKQWRYFADHVSEKTQYLPPDNVQFSPRCKEAMRTSPTNIGLYLMSAVAAYDFGFIKREEAICRITNTISTVERLEKWNGHLYNWYDIRDGSVLGSPFVSTVDSGNFYLALTTVRQALLEKSLHAEDLAERIEKLLLNARFRLLYREDRDLFTIGYDTVGDVPSQNCYDLYMSEARAASYYAIARGEVPEKNWERLSRLSLKKRGYAGIYSWSGTAFEYFLPLLWLPVYPGTQDDEALKFALWEQKSASVRYRKKKYFGISESGFFAHDREMNYQYYAFGCPGLRLDPEGRTERVISPYALFLMLQNAEGTEAEEIAEVMENLRTLDGEGPYGLYEAFDFTKARVGNGYAVIRSYMAHHVGMSLCAIDNLINERIMQKRFFRDDEMKSASVLLETKIDPDPVVFKADESIPYSENVPALEAHAENIVEQENGAFCISDSVLCFLINRNGKCMLSYGDYLLFEENFPITFRIGSRVIRFFGEYEDCKTKVIEEDGMYRLYKESETFSCSVLISLSKTGGGISFACSVKTGLQGPVSVTIDFRPILEKRRGYTANPAFSKLFMETKTNPETNQTLFCRKHRECGEKERILLIRTDVSPASITTTASGCGGEDGAFAPCIEPCYRAEIPAERCTVSLVFANDENTAQSRIGEGSGNDDFMPRILEGRERVTFSDILQYLTDGAERILPIRYPYSLSKEDLWKYGISGDQKIAVLDCREDDSVPRIMNARMYSALRIEKQRILYGIRYDFVILFHEKDSYHASEQKRIEKAVRRAGLLPFFGQTGGIFAVPDNQDGALGSALYELAFYRYEQPYTKALHKSLRILTDDANGEIERTAEQVMGSFENGGFSCSRGQKMRAWSYFLANRHGGTILLSNGLGKTWYCSAERGLLMKPVSIHDQTSVCERVLLSQKHGMAYDLCAMSRKTTFLKDSVLYEGTADGIIYSVRIRFSEKLCAKYIDVSFPDRIPDGYRVVYDASLLLGDVNSAGTLHCVGKSEHGFLFRNAYSEIFRDAVTEIYADAETVPILFSQNGEYYCALNPVKGKREYSFVLLCYRTEAEREYLLKKDPRCCGEEPETQISFGSERISRFVSDFLPRQILRSRLFGKTGPQQPGGAYGFRDQLQDVVGLLTDRPELAKEQILRSAAHQFKSGDVLHWWFREKVGDKAVETGIRTACSDDYLWLVFAVLSYLSVTRDYSILKIEIPYLEAEALRPGETERYLQVPIGDEKETLYTHVIRALEHGLRFGTHGLPLFGSGDWNDGMNCVGADGKGESVWLGYFLLLLLLNMIPLCRELGDTIGEHRYREQANDLKEALRTFGKSGSWYLRGYFDDGEPFGKKGDGACEIDVLPQAFAAFAAVEEKDDEETVFAMRALALSLEKLWLEDRHILSLFSPPFVSSSDRVGYVSAYVSGVRENGGQYTHAAIWTVLSLFSLGENEKAAKLLLSITPADFSKSFSEAERYGGEPYVLAGDVYRAKGYEGRAGWTWYTGSGAWYRFTVLHGLFGIHPKGDRVELRPRLSDTIPSCRFSGKILSTPYEIEASLGEKGSISFDGARCDAFSSFPLDERPHTVKIIVKRKK